MLEVFQIIGISLKNSMMGIILQAGLENLVDIINIRDILCLHSRSIYLPKIFHDANEVTSLFGERFNMDIVYLRDV